MRSSKFPPPARIKIDVDAWVEEEEGGKGVRPFLLFSVFFWGGEFPPKRQNFSIPYLNWVGIPTRRFRFGRGEGNSLLPYGSGFLSLASTDGISDFLMDISSSKVNSVEN